VHQVEDSLTDGDTVLPVGLVTCMKITDFLDTIDEIHIDGQKPAGFIISFLTWSCRNSTQYKIARK
jgi:hypothetical protein